MRDYRPIDNLLMHAQQILSTLVHHPQGTGRPTPGRQGADRRAAEAERRQSIALMRVNHTGEVCAQALYQAQGVTARSAEVREHMRRAAVEENDHLVWCHQRLQELGGRTSHLNPLWYAGSLAIGALAGLAGDRWSLGFVGETERQVVEHLEGHLQRLPAADQRSREIVMQMRLDEDRHGTAAMAAGGSELPLPMRLLMRAQAKVMTTLAARI